MILLEILMYFDSLFVKIFTTTDRVLRLLAKNKAQNMQDLYGWEEILKNNYWSCKKIKQLS